MSETRNLALVLLALMSVFLAWGIHSEWRNVVIGTESGWLIEILGHQAFELGQSTDIQLKHLLGEAMAQEPGTFGEGLVLGLRQVFIRIAILERLIWLVVISAVGHFHEARTLRALRAARFTYTSPLHYRRIQSLPMACLLISLVLLVAPIPLHPLLLLTSLIGMNEAAAWRYVLYMKQT